MSCEWRVTSCELQVTSCEEFIGESTGTTRSALATDYSPLPMTPNPFLGVFFHWLGGLASGSFYVPYRFVRQWSWETYWLTGGFFSWIIAPWLLGLIMTRDLPAVISEGPGSTL